MAAQRRFCVGVPSSCWCGRDVVIFYSKTNENPFRRFYRCEIGAQRKKKSDLFKWCDEAFLDEIHRVDLEQRRIAEEIEDLKKSLKKMVEEEVKKHTKDLEVGCLGSILWLFGRSNREE